MSRFLAVLFVLCLTLPASAQQLPDDREQLHVFLLMGQSNMSGYGQVTKGDDKPVAGIFVLGGECNKNTADPQSPVEWRPAAHPVHRSLPTDRFGLSLPFAKAYLARHPGVSVGLVPCAWGGAAIDAIGPGSATWKNAMGRARKAEQRGLIKGILWHQGESDTVFPDRADAYAGKLDSLIARARQELNHADLPFVVGDLAPFYGTGAGHDAPDRVARIRQVRQALRELPGRVEHTAFAGSQKTSSPDRHLVHFDRASYITLGKRYAAAFKMTNLPVLAGKAAKPAKEDYLVRKVSRAATAFRSVDGRELVLDNGLLRRTWRLSPNGACVGFDNLMTGNTMLRSVRPEARVTIDGVPYDIGGLTGQPNHAFLTPEWLDVMTTDPGAFRLVDFEVGVPSERFGWHKKRHAAPDAVWPPKGIYLRMDYAIPADSTTTSTASNVGRKTLWTDSFAQLTDDWSTHVSDAHARTSFVNEGKAGEIYAVASTHCFAQRSLPAETELIEVVIHPGTDTGTSFGPGLAWVFDRSVVKFNLRPNDRGEHGQFELRINGRERLASHDGFASEDGGLKIDSAYRLRMRASGQKLVCEAAVVNQHPAVYHQLFELNRDAEWGKSVALRVGKMDRNGGSTDEKQFPGELSRCRIQHAAAYGRVDQAAIERLKEDRDEGDRNESRQIGVSVHYEMYDRLPVMSKWVTVHNNSSREITIDRFTGEELALVEHSNWVESRDGVEVPRPDYLHVETDFAFGGFSHENANRHAVHWRPDPLYTSQVNYARKTPCLLVCEPTYGPAQRVASGETFEGFRVFELAYDDANRERRGLALRRMYRTIAPWVTENPITHHLLSNNPERVRDAIDQAAQVGFEAIILSFGSGFNMENRDPKFLAEWKGVADYAAKKNIELGCYSLFSSRGVGDANMIVSPEGQRPTHGKCPAVTSSWGQQWLRTIREFYVKTGFDQFENDGPYPGDIDIAARPPLQQGVDDSRWVQWRMTAGLYRDLRKRGIYINAPDYYFLNGSNKCGMGYREVNWSLPRAHQVIHTRQNIYDGSWSKVPSMGWMFVPLSQYHGGGAAATIEPLHQHLDHYEQMMRSNFSLGVQAHYRGPRLFDTDQTRDKVSQIVTWFKQYRDILESDLIHGRRADGRDLDWMLHVNPQLKHTGMLVVFNPRSEPVTKELKINLYYTGLTESAVVRHLDRTPNNFRLKRDHSILLPVTVPANSMTWYTIGPERN